MFSNNFISTKPIRYQLSFCSKGVYDVLCLIPVLVERLPVLGVERRLLLYLVHKGGNEGIHLHCLAGEHLQDLGDTATVLNNAKLYEEAGQAVFVVLLARLGIVPRQFFELQPK